MLFLLCYQRKQYKYRNIYTYFSKDYTEPYRKLRNRVPLNVRKANTRKDIQVFDNIVREATAYTWIENEFREYTKIDGVSMTNMLPYQIIYTIQRRDTYKTKTLVTIYYQWL